MGRVAEGPITVGSGRIVGRVRVDPSAVRAHGGPLQSRLIIPVAVEMHSRPADQMIALVKLTGTLSPGPVNVLGTEVGSPCSIDLIENMPCRSLPDGTTSHTVELSFPLSAATVRHIENIRHQSGAGSFALNLVLVGSLAWLEHTQSGSPQGASDTDPFTTMFGLHSRLNFFWNTRIDPLAIVVEPSAWITNVLPGFGIDRVRLVELELPPPLPSHRAASARWDEATRALHEQRYGDCVSHCRAILASWNTELGATKKRHVADIVGEKRAWAEDDVRKRLLDNVWQGLTDTVNATHHPEGQASPLEPTPADAEFHLLLTGILSGYVSRLLGP